MSHRGIVDAAHAVSEQAFATSTRRVRQEERDARAEHKRRRRLAQAARVRAARAWRRRLAQAIRDTKTKTCTCPLEAGMSREDLVALGAGCTTGFVCPRLAKVRRRVGL